MIKLYQQIIGTVVDNIRVSMDIQKTKHAGQRQSRDEDDFGVIISRSFLKDINKFLGDIIE